MTDGMDRRDALAAELSAQGWTVIDTVGGFDDSPSLVVQVSDIDIVDHTVPTAIATMTVTEGGFSIDRVTVTDDPLDVLEDVREAFTAAADEQLEDPDITIWEFDSDSAAVDVDDVRSDVRPIYDQVADGDDETDSGSG